jgi:formylglycine-generating enzyme required for sulfatase activity
MIRIEGGEFQMGCTPGDSECASDESPHHTVAISAFKMSAYEITQYQWEQVMGSNPSYFDDCGSNCPVESVSWNLVKEFIDALNKKTGKQYRLPTEAEWEYAARADKEPMKWYCGDKESCVDSIAWYEFNSKSTPHPVGQKTKNRFGLYDMSGNVWEWVSDWHAGNYYSFSPKSDPQGPSNGARRVIRGGCIYDRASSCRSAERSWEDPESGYPVVGFRLCLPQ